MALLPEQMEISFLAARVLRELRERGELCSGLASDMSRALFGTGPLVKRSLLAARLQRLSQALAKPPGEQRNYLLALGVPDDGRLV